MAQSLVVTVNHNPYLDGRDPANIVLDWVSAGDGTVSLPISITLAAANLAAAGGNTAVLQPTKLRGVLHKIETIPGLKGDKATDTPTALYDITLLDAYGLDVADGTIINRSATVAEVVVYSQKYILDTELTLTIANAGDTKKGRIIIDLLESENRP